MNRAFNKKQIFSLVILLSLVLILPLTLFLARQRQEVRKKAEETRKEIVLFLDPQTNNQANPWPAEHEQTINVKMRNITSNKTLRFRVVGLELNFNSQVFEIQTSDLRCTSPFVIAGGNASRVENNLLSLVCYAPPAGTGPSDPQSLTPGAEVNVGSFKVKVKQNPPGGSTNIAFARTNIPEEGSLEDLSKFGDAGIYYITGPQITGTPTPTPTSEVTPTPTPTSTITPTPTPTPTTAPNTASLTFKIKFQLITSQGRKLNKNVRVILKQGETEKYREVIEVSSDQNAVYSGTLVNITPGTYDILIKGWAHLQKKFQNITLNEGENVVDWSGTPLIVGDTYGNNLGDNKIQMEDVTAVIANWIQNSTPVTSTNLRYDLDDNGFIQMEDVTAVIANWTEYIRRGEE